MTATLILLGAFFAVVGIAVFSIMKWEIADDKVAQFQDALSDTEAVWARDYAIMRLQEAEISRLRKDFHAFAMQKQPRCPVCKSMMSRNKPCKRCATKAEKAIDPIEKPLRSLIAQAKAEGKNIRCHYQDMIFTPDDLLSLLAQGRFRWWNGNWELTDRKQNFYTPVSTADGLQSVDEMIKEIKPEDLQNAPFEGLEGVKEGAPLLMSDKSINHVRCIYYSNGNIATDEAYPDKHGKPFFDLFNLSDGKHRANGISIRIIRIATEQDIAKYGKNSKNSKGE